MVSLLDRLPVEVRRELRQRLSVVVRRDRHVLLRGRELVPDLLVHGRRERAHAPTLSTANSCHSPGTPFSSCAPRWENAMPEPATRSLTVLDTSTSPGRRVTPRAPPCGQRYPPPSRPRSRTRPYAGLRAPPARDRPSRPRSRSRTGWRVLDRRSWRRSRRPPCPPPRRETAGARAARERDGARGARATRGRRATSRARSDSTMSVKSTVVRTRSGSTASHPPDSHTPVEETLNLVRERQRRVADVLVTGPGQLDKT